MVITVDNLPAQRAEALPLARQEEITRGVVGALARRHVPAIGFVTLATLASGATNMVVEMNFPSSEELQQMIDMDMAEGIALAVGQIEAILSVTAA